MKDIVIFVLVALVLATNGLMTSNMVKKKTINLPFRTQSSNAPSITTSCNTIDLNAKYNYSGIVATGYLNVGRGNSALAFTFYGKKDIKTKS